jgi:hypothetical protein
LRKNFNADVDGNHFRKLSMVDMEITLNIVCSSRSISVAKVETTLRK